MAYSPLPNCNLVVPLQEMQGSRPLLGPIAVRLAGNWQEIAPNAPQVGSGWPLLVEMLERASVRVNEDDKQNKQMTGSRLSNSCRSGCGQYGLPPDHRRAAAHGTLVSGR